MDVIIAILSNVLGAVFNVLNAVNSSTSNEEMYTGSVVNNARNITSQEISSLNNALSAQLNQNLGVTTQEINSLNNAISAQFSSNLNLTTQEINSLNYSLNNQFANLSNITTQEINSLNNGLNNLYGGIAAMNAQEEQALNASLSNMSLNVSAKIASSTEELNRGLTDINMTAQEQEALTAGLVALLAQSNSPAVISHELSFWDELSVLPQVLTTLISMLPEKMAEAFFSQITGLQDDIGNSISSQWDFVKQSVDKFSRGEYKDFNDAIKDMEAHQIHASIIMFIMNGASIILMLVKLITSKSGPIFEAIDRYSWADNPTKTFDINTLIRLFLLGDLKYPKYVEIGKQLGYSEEILGHLAYAARQYPDINSLMQFVWRGLLDTDKFRTILLNMGFQQDLGTGYLALLHTVPSPQDLTRIADKRVWSQNTAPKYGQYSEMPQEYVSQMAKWGYDEQYIKWIWAAHWQLPSPNEVFEMAHRGLLQPGDRETYLGLTDWLPYFRDKLFDITYNLLTRVDVRRLYKAGILSDSELHQEHLKMGYTEQDATRLDGYVRSTKLPEDNTDLTALENKITSAVESAYATGRIDRTTAHSMLTQLGNTEMFATISLELLDFELSINDVTPIKKNLQQNTIDLIRTSYKKHSIPKSDAYNWFINFGYTVDEANQELNLLDLDNIIRLKTLALNTEMTLVENYTIDQVEFYNRLSPMGFTSGEIELAYSEALIKRDGRVKLLTVAQLKKLFDTGVIDIDQYAAKLKGLGYTDESVQWLITSDVGSITG